MIWIFVMEKHLVLNQNQSEINNNLDQYASMRFFFFLQNLIDNEISQASTCRTLSCTLIHVCKHYIIY